MENFERYLPEIDVADALARLRSNKKLYKLVLRSFNAHELMGSLRNAIDSGNPAEVSAAAHALKGVAANLSAVGVVKAAREIELSGKNGMVDEAQYAALEVQVSAALSKIEALLVEIE